MYDNWKTTLLPIFLENLKPKTGHDEDWITNLLAKIDRSGSVDCVAGSGRLRTVSAACNVAVVEELACVPVPGAHFEHKFGLFWTELLLLLFLRARVQPTLDPYAEAFYITGPLRWPRRGGVWLMMRASVCMTEGWGRAE